MLVKKKKKVRKKIFILPKLQNEEISYTHFIFNFQFPVPFLGILWAHEKPCNIFLFSNSVPSEEFVDSFVNGVLYERRN